jgi:hypothetical protein
VKLLIDNNPRQIERLKAKYDFIGGQLLTPLTRNRNAGGVFGIDNGAFSNFNERAWRAVIAKQDKAWDRCLFVTLPDIVGEAQRTRELFMHFRHELSDWPIAMVAQDGAECIEIPWTHMSAVFIGGTTEWKMSRAAAGVIKTAKILEKHVHVGRINTPDRWKHFDELGADTCDGSGVSRFDWMLDDIAAMRINGKHMPLLRDSESGDSSDSEPGQICGTSLDAP